MTVEWRTSSRSRSVGNCVAVAALPEGVGVRDSKAPEQGHLPLPRRVLARMKDGDLDLRP
ncbi:hypothetical protein BTM25_25010 [Actinomadura rubteroloni]|uniref:DUF397 domain-containing protein n=1 Tax=Actinomadura rubteroloni TaxID=1926885 RepID=A0A2P4UFR1_9ACTN|nr:DUF397 domain-containing protein [Actinomadura rubteroloni]POM23875.1 hypothetical protein BTM25_25010 [Actinomadura rubteroloni]